MGLSYVGLRKTDEKMKKNIRTTSTRSHIRDMRLAFFSPFPALSRHSLEQYSLFAGMDLPQILQCLWAGMVVDILSSPVN